MPGPKNKNKNKGKGNSKTKSTSTSQLNVANPNQFSALEAEDDETTRRNQPPMAKNTGNGKKKSPNVECFTLEEDEMTRCNQPATEGNPRRCKVHQAQYRTMYKKYKDASKVVDDIKSGSDIPTKEQIERYADLDTTLKKARWVRKYLESIRVERTGRDIHSKRFFLKGGLSPSNWHDFSSINCMDS
jgi:hypothetical protein